MLKTKSRALHSIGAATLAACLSATPVCALADEWERPDSPFRMGEAYPEIPASCETARYWIDHAPETENRTTFAISGKLTGVNWDGALAYLLMCGEAGVEVMCVTYSKDGRNVGDTVLFAGGYIRAGERQIMLDPCLASVEK